MTQRQIVLMLLFVIGPGLGAAWGQVPAVEISGGRGRGGLPVVIGPPAPVPPEAAMPRPTPAELEQVNPALKHYCGIWGDAVGAQLAEMMK